MPNYAVLPQFRIGQPRLHQHRPGVHRPGPMFFLQGWQIGVYNTITVGADNIRPQPYRMDSTHIHRKCSKTGTFRADNIRPYGGNAMCLKTSNTNLSLCPMALYQEKYTAKPGKKQPETLKTESNRDRLKETPINSARADSEIFCFLRKFGKPRNTVCISDFPNCAEEEKDPLFSRRRFVQRFPNKVPEKSGTRVVPQRFSRLCLLQEAKARFLIIINGG